MHIISREHKRNPSMQQNQAEKSTQQREMCYGLSKQDSVGKKKGTDQQHCGVGGGGFIPGSGRGVGFKLMVFRLQLNCSYLHHNVKGVLVDQEHKSKEKLLPVSQRQKKM